jgi:hypothetical protein
MTMQLAILEWFAAGVLLVRGLCVLNAMTWRTWLPVKVAYLGVTIAAGALLFAPFDGAEIDLAAYAHPCITIALTMLLLLDRRLALRLRDEA